jgi:hypothetical protein
MPQPNDLSRSLVALDQDSTIIAVVEMSQSSWLIGGIIPGIERQPRKKLFLRGSLSQLLYSKLDLLLLLGLRMRHIFAVGDYPSRNRRCVPKKLGSSPILAIHWQTNRAYCRVVIGRSTPVRDADAGDQKEGGVRRATSESTLLSPE